MEKEIARSDRVELRLESREKEAFQKAASLAGLSLSSWIRERLRRDARTELFDAGLPVPFIQSKK